MLLARMSENDLESNPTFAPTKSTAKRLSTSLTVIFRVGSSSSWNMEIDSSDADGLAESFPRLPRLSGELDPDFGDPTETSDFFSPTDTAWFRSYKQNAKSATKGLLMIGFLSATGGRGSASVPSPARLQRCPLARLAHSNRKRTPSACVVGAPPRGLWPANAVVRALMNLTWVTAPCNCTRVCTNKNTISVKAR